jgi:hypothetical protein
MEDLRIFTWTKKKIKSVCYVSTEKINRSDARSILLNRGTSMFVA